MNLAELQSKPWFWPSIVVVSSTTTGAIGYILGKHNGDVFPIEQDVLSEKSEYTELASEYDSAVLAPIHILDDELVSRQLDHEEPTETFSEAAEAFQEDDDITTIEATPVKVVKEKVKANIFEYRDRWDMDHELARRPMFGSIYIIHRDEFIEDDMGYSQHTYTYYSKDDIMADETDTPIYNYKKVVGELQFGHGSGDKNVVYVRNEERRAEYEILYSGGSFEIEVLGQQVEQEYAETDIKHSNNFRFRSNE